MNKLDKDYLALLQDILDNGTKKETRNGDTISVFGRQIRHSMKDGFPLLTTKKMHWKSIVTELLWFLRGDTSIEYLLENGCHIWDGDAYKNYEKWWKSYSPGGAPIPLSREMFIDRIKTDDEFANKWGNLGKIYGHQWRSWTNYTGDEINEGTYEMTNEPIDQISELIRQLKDNPNSRRLLVSAWAVHDLPNMVLPPCHYGFQVYTRELSLEERCDEYIKRNPKDTNDGVLNYKWIGDNLCTHEHYDKWNIPTRAISLMWNQRSCDVPLGIPFNIASYGLLLEIIAKMVNMVPDELIGNLGDCHIYSNQIDGVIEQIGRELSLDERTKKMYEINKGDTEHLFTQTDPSHQLYDNLNVPKRTREPYSLPTLSLSNQINFNEGIDEFLNSCLISDFIIEGYKSHPTIKCPLSN